MEWTDLIGEGLRTYSALEQAKIDARLAASREQYYAYEQASRSAAAVQQAAPMPAWVLPVLGLGALGLVVWVIAK